MDVFARDCRGRGTTTLYDGGTEPDASSPSDRVAKWTVRRRSPGKRSTYSKIEAFFQCCQRGGGMAESRSSAARRHRGYAIGHACVATGMPKEGHVFVARRLRFTYQGVKLSKSRGIGVFADSAQHTGAPSDMSQVGAYLRARDAHEHPAGAREHPPAPPAEPQWRMGTHVTGSHKP